jgi:putative hemolysin
MNLELLVEFFVLFCLLILSAFFSGSETGLFSLSSVRIHRLIEEKKKGAILVSELLKEPRKILATLLLSNLFVNVFSTSLAEGIASDLFGPKGLEICIVVMSLTILIFCDLVPKVIAVSKAETVALGVALPLKFFMFILTPIRVVLLKVASVFIDFIMPKGAPQKEPLSAEQLKTAISMGYQEGVLSSEESAMLGGILELKYKIVKELMTPREEIFAFEMQTPLLTIYEEIRKRKISRVPIFRKDLDDIVGILYAKDLVMQEIVELRAIQIFDLMRTPMFIQESMRLDHLLKEFRRQGLHMALVQDTNKKLSGLITLDDLMETVIGQVLEDSTSESDEEK